MPVLLATCPLIFLDGLAAGTFKGVVVKSKSAKRDFIIERLYIYQHHYFAISSLKVGGVEKFDSDDPIPATAFVEGRLALQYRCKKGSSVEMVVHNLVLSSSAFLGVFGGPVLSATMPTGE
ncbi:MAG: hypothetical protein JRD89_02245 [Deltaproteobacteria bacterium]|nr:hypothetical protein [Deltaproteobacteria bacterium]